MALLGLGVRLAFVLKGNIAFNSDEVYGSDYIKGLVTGDAGDCTYQPVFEGIRKWIGCLFYALTNGWVGFGALTGIFITTFFSILWVLWVHQKISKLAAWFMACALTVPSISSIYYITHFDERRVETLCWGSLLVFYSGRWLGGRRWAIIFGALVGWAFWCEPFILFFAVPVVIYELWMVRSSPSAVSRLAQALAGLAGGALLGFWGNGPFTTLGPHYLKFGLADGAGFRKNLSLLAGAFPQYWNGNLPFGYLQGSKFGLYVDPMIRGWGAVFLSAWTGILFLAAAWGFYRLAGQKKSGNPGLALMGAGPAAIYVLFFIFSAQVWDATSFRYLTYLFVFQAMGLGLFFDFLVRWKKTVGTAIFLIWFFLQGFLLTNRFERMPALFPAQIIAENFKLLGLRSGFANHWVSEAARFLSRGEVLLSDYAGPSSRRAWAAVHEDDRIGGVVVEGLDRPPVVERAVSELEKGGYQFTKVWPMVGDWAIIELRKSNPSKDRQP